MVGKRAWRPYGWVIAAILFLVLIAATAHAKELWSVHPRNYASGYNARVYITNADPATPQVADIYDDSGLIASYTVPPLTSVTHDLNSPLIGSQRTFAKSIYVDGSDTVFGTLLSGKTASRYTSDATRLLARDDLGSEYWAFTPRTTGDGTWPGFLSILAVEDNTNVEVTPSVTTAAGGGVPAIPAGTTASFTIDKFEVLHIEAGGSWTYGGTTDLTGSHITSDKKVAVFSGHACINHPGTACDTYMEQLHPVVRAGTEFTACSQRVIDPSLKDRYKFMATAPGVTTVTLDPPALGGIASFTLSGPGDWEFLRHTQDVYITSDKPIQVVQAPQYDGGGVVTVDPSYIELTPTAFWQVDHNFPVPSGGWLDSMSVAAPAGASVTFDGSPLTGWKPIGSSGFGCLTVGVSDGDHVLSSDLGSTLTVLGRASYSSYFYVSDDLIGELVPDFDWDTPPCVNSMASFEDLSTTVHSAFFVRAIWDWGDGSTTVVDPWNANVTHTYRAPGWYTVNLTVVDSRGEVGTIEKDYFVCNDPPIIITPSESFVTEGQELVHWVRTTDPNGDAVTLSVLGGPPGLLASDGRLFWQTSLGDALASPYNVPVLATDTWGASSGTNITIHVLPPDEVPAGPADRDGDGVPDMLDNCPESWNPAQEGGSYGTGEQCLEADGGGGDAAPGSSQGQAVAVKGRDQPTKAHGSNWVEAPGDIDGDGVLDMADNCVFTVNAIQLDQDQDGIGDACDPDIDGDGVPQLDGGGRPLDLCPYEPEPRRVDGCPFGFAVPGALPGLPGEDGAAPLQGDHAHDGKTGLSAMLPMVGGAVLLVLVALGLLLLTLRRR